MRLLLDTHVLLWALSAPERLRHNTYDALSVPDNSVVFSPVSIWEIAIKFRLRRPDFPFDPRLVLRAALTTGFVELPTRSDAAVLVAELPPYHRGPFDRLLIAQALAEALQFVTADPVFFKYGELEGKLWEA